MAGPYRCAARCNRAVAGDRQTTRLMAELTYDKKFTPASVGAMLGFFGVHIAALGAFFTGISTTDIVVCVTLYWVRIFAIGAGYHHSRSGG